MTEAYVGSIGSFAETHGLVWALDRCGAFVGGTDRDTDEHLLECDAGKVIGILKYRRHPGEIHLAHLLIEPSRRCSGTGGRLLDSFLAHIRSTPQFEGWLIKCEIVSTEPQKVAHMLKMRGFLPHGPEWQLQQ